ncbi:hypothetical protein BTH160X_220013 [Brochothrix thermosphacta]|nr:hypothetical protein BTH160X_220013 [Brochothrix thermosphacta]SPN74561.1 conserved hypothetical protein [Brochothrix thermosphacta]
MLIFAIKKHYPDKKRQNSVLSNLFGAKRLLLLSIIPISSVLNRV